MSSAPAVEDAISGPLPRTVIPKVKMALSGDFYHAALLRREDKLTRITINAIHLLRFLVGQPLFIRGETTKIMGFEFVEFLVVMFPQIQPRFLVRISKQTSRLIESLPVTFPICAKESSPIFLVAQVYFFAFLALNLAQIFNGF